MAKIKAYKEVSLENYTRVRANLSPYFRRAMPSLSQIYDKKTGNWKIEQRVGEDLLHSVEAFLNREGATRSSQTRWRKAKNKNEGLGANVFGDVPGHYKTPAEGILSAYLGPTAKEKKEGKRGVPLSPTERARAGTALFALRGKMNIMQQKIVSTNAEALWGREFYEVKYFIENDKFDINKVENSQILQLVRGIGIGQIHGTLTVSDVDIINSRYERLTGQSDALYIPKGITSIHNEIELKTGTGGLTKADMAKYIESIETIIQSVDLTPIRATAGANKGATYNGRK